MQCVPRSSREPRPTGGAQMLTVISTGTRMVLEGSEVAASFLGMSPRLAPGGGVPAGVGGQTG